MRSRDEDPEFFSTDPDPAQLKKFRIRNRPDIEMKKNIYIYIRYVGIKFDIITHHFLLEFVDSDLYFIQDKNFFINSLLQVESGSGSGSVEKSTGSGSGGQKITGSGSSSLVKTRLRLYSSMNRTS